MARRRQSGIYELTDQDYDVFKAGALNANAFTDFYLRRPGSGTLYHPDQMPRIPEYDYAEVTQSWKDAGSPDAGIFMHEGQNWTPVWRYSDVPGFLYLHGFIFLPWQLAIHHAAQKIRIVCGGFSSGKSDGMVGSILTLAATIPYFKAMCVAPSFFQAQILYKAALRLTEGTPYQERFMTRKPISAPFPIITITNSHVRESTIEFRSASDDGISILSWRGDLALIDQAELIPSISKLQTNLGSRLVGQAPNGRPYMGIMTWLANAGPSPALWELYEKGTQESDEYVSLTVTSYDNPHNTEKALRHLEQAVGGTQEAIDQWLLAKKPITAGVHFSDQTINLCRDTASERIMAKAIKEKRHGFVFEEDGCGIYQWFMPREPERTYLVAGDPGWGNRPDRNSPVIMVWDITEWPKDAYLRGFHWMEGNAAITPFLSEFTHLVEKYHAHGQCIYDGTGMQKGYDELSFQLNDLTVEPMDFARNKLMFLNALKVLMENGLIHFPYIGGIWQQLAEYNLPDTKLKQDIVSTMMMAAYWLRDRMGPSEEDEESEKSIIEAAKVDDRFFAPGISRFGGMAR